MNTSSAMEFIEYFFNSPLEASSKLATVLVNTENLIWPYLEIKDILSYSVTSKSSASLVLTERGVNAILQSDPRISHIGKFQIVISSPMTLGILRRTIFRLVQEKTLSLSIGTNGRILLDIGSAFNDRDAFLASATLIPNDNNTDEAEEDDEITDMVIQKHLEIASYDEYDDFTPRHPLPKDKTHRRGNSLFNSDIEVYANQALNMDDIASLALDELNLRDDEHIPPVVGHHRRRNNQ